jgi:hypothetical protein
MPPRLPISDNDRARRHVLRQQAYRLRRKYRYLMGQGMYRNAHRVLDQLQQLNLRYQALGGSPKHRGNKL